MSSAARHLLTLLQIPGVGPARARKWAQGNPQGTLEPASLEAAGLRGLAPTALTEAACRARRIEERCHDHQIRVLSMGDPDYPARLRAILDAPPLLYVRGSLAALSSPALAVVGTRQASHQGQVAAQAIAKHLVGRQLAVVSGLALGIDAAAHRGALEARGVTIAVLAHGLDTIQPTTNRPLGEEVLARGGALVSEHPPGVPARPAEFVRRNRIQSGLSLGSIVVESGAQGGSIHQAQGTVAQGRALFVVWPRVQTESFNLEGAQVLLERHQAIPLASTADLERHLSRN